MELWAKKIFILFPWLLICIFRPFLQEDNPVRDWTWSELAIGGTDLLYFYGGSLWYSVVVIVILIKSLYSSGG